MSSEIHIGDTTKFVILVMDGSTVVDLSTTTSITVTLKKPDGTKLTKTPTFVTNGSDGYITFTTTTTDLDTSGYWSIQSFIVTSTKSWHTDIQKIQVLPNL